MRWRWLVSLCLFAMACDRAKLRGEIRCRALTGEIPGDARFGECADGATRRIRCTEGSDDWTCTCEVNGKLVRTFSHRDKTAARLADDPARAIELANRRCKWELFTP